ncbi:hypothetical protein [Colwellia sp. 75C3]|uniref:hypothetical protein n=1 Tax=Colwellia sp. 75C3 TaxID=888425 RepID=UPI000C33F981|nr:hypothetical protein [Colwellia sp. 75C3]
MNITKSVKVSIYSGLVSVVIGLITFTLNWNLWEFFEGLLPGYNIFLFPGNLTLIYFWHPIFTEEVNFWPKLLMLLLGQFVVVSSCVAMISNLYKFFDTKLHNKQINQDK